MPATGHSHRMEPIAWSTPQSDWPPHVLFGCTTGVCAKTVSVAPNQKSRTHPDFITDAQFEAMKAGKHWNEIVAGG